MKKLPEVTLPKERKKNVLSGKAKKLQAGVFDEGKRLTIKEWAEELYGNINRTNGVYNLMKTLRGHGFTVVSMPRDPDMPNEPGVLTPLTESRDVSRFANRRQKTRMDSTMLVFGVQIIQELEVYDDMQPEILEMMEDTLQSLIGQKKMLLEDNSKTYVRKSLPSGNGSR